MDSNYFTVCIPIERDFLWLAMLQWLESAVGDMGEEWDIIRDPIDIVYIFRSRDLAEHFGNVWNRDPLFLPYGVWEEFCQSPISHARMQSYWRGQGWTPSYVIFGQLSGMPTKSKRVMYGGNYSYRSSSKVWFFETFTDAMVFWIDNNG